ncbi:MAG TPA: hypothetical protein PLI71_09360 [Clostridia bacterium]|nr:hypothetical protein [Clostridia bacterium]
MSWIPAKYNPQCQPSDIRIEMKSNKNLIEIKYLCKRCGKYFLRKDLVEHFGYLPPIEFEQAGNRNYPPNMLYK